MLLNTRENGKKHIWLNFTNNNSDEFVLYITQLTNNKNDDAVKLTFNDNRFVITKFVKNIIQFNITNFRYGFNIADMIILTTFKNFVCF